MELDYVTGPAWTSLVVVFLPFSVSESFEPASEICNVGDRGMNTIGVE
jgi:hypothetical protein